MSYFAALVADRGGRIHIGWRPHEHPLCNQFLDLIPIPWAVMLGPLLAERGICKTCMRCVASIGQEAATLLDRPWEVDR